MPLGHCSTLQELKTFPYHVHLPNDVKESKQVTLIAVLDKIKEVVAAGLESYAD